VYDTTHYLIAIPKFNEVRQKMTSRLPAQFFVNGRQVTAKASLRYAPVVVVCLGGLDATYLNAAAKRGLIPTMERFRKYGHYSIVSAMMPTYSTPNNISIVTGSFPEVHGVISYRGGASINCQETYLNQFFHAGYRVGAITARKELLTFLRTGLAFDPQSAQCPVAISVDEASNLTWDHNGFVLLDKYVGRPPDMASTDGSTALYVLRAGVHLQSDIFTRRDLLYLSTDDSVFRNYGPEDDVALEFLTQFDRILSKFVSLGSVVGITADHGMSAKASGVVYLGEILTKTHAGSGLCLVDLPSEPDMTLGSYAIVKVAEQGQITDVLAVLRKTPGIALALTSDEACDRFGVPPCHHIVVVAKKDYALGNTVKDHSDYLTKLNGFTLRTAGSESEGKVPFILSHRIDTMVPPPMYNADIIQFATTHTE